MAVIQSSLRVNRHKHIVVHMCRIRVVSSPVLKSGTEYLQGARPKEMFAWDFRERFHKRLRLEIGHCSQLFGVVFACKIEGANRSVLSETVSFAVIRFLSHKDSETNIFRGNRSLKDVS